MKNSKQPAKFNDHHQENAYHKTANTPFSAADLPIGEESNIYHIQVKPGQIAPNILLVGDPGRARFIAANFLRDIEFENEHRGLVTITGLLNFLASKRLLYRP